MMASMASTIGVAAAPASLPQAGGASRRLPQLVPVGLVLAATALCLGTRDLFTPDLSAWAYAGIALALLVFRGWWERWGAHGRVSGTLGFVLHSLACLALCALHPLYGFYAFVGYFDAVRVFRWPVLWLGILAVATATGLSQAGGVHGVWAVPWLYVLIVLINAGLSGTMIAVEHRREEAVTRREEAIRLLETAQRENAALQAQLVAQARESGILEERARLSREIHDTVAQGLLGVITQLEAVDVADPSTQARIDRAGRAARESLAEARRAVVALASPHLDGADLPTALHGLVRRWGESADVAATMVVEGPPGPSPHDAELVRIAQEALSNVARHGDARRATLTLTFTPEEVRLDVRDDGRGFLVADPGDAGPRATGPTDTDPTRPVDPVGSHAHRGHGIAGMRARLERCGGSFAVESAPGRGCVVSAAVPR